MRASELQGDGGGLLVISWRVMEEGSLGFRGESEKNRKNKNKKSNGDDQATTLNWKNKGKNSVRLTPHLCFFFLGC